MVVLNVHDVASMTVRKAVITWYRQLLLAATLAGLSNTRSDAFLAFPLRPLFLSGLYRYFTLAVVISMSISFSPGFRVNVNGG